MGNHLRNALQKDFSLKIDIYFWKTSTKWSVYFNSIALYVIILANMQVNSVIVLKLLLGTSQTAFLNAKLSKIHSRVPQICVLRHSVSYCKLQNVISQA